MYANNKLLLYNNIINSLCVRVCINKIIWYHYLIIIIGWVYQNNTFKLVIHPKKRKMA